MSVSIRKAVSTYLSKTMNPAMLIFPVSELKNQYKGFSGWNNSCFTVFVNGEQMIINGHRNVHEHPHYNIRRHLLSSRPVFDILTEDNGHVSISTKGEIPSRWLHMINDFGLNGKGHVIERTVNYTKKIEDVPDFVINSLATNSFVERQRFQFQVFRGPKVMEDCKWSTKGEWSECTTHVVQHAGQFASADGIYGHSNGDLYVHNKYSQNFLDFAKAIRPGIKVMSKCGSTMDTYCTCDTITLEELTVMQLAFKELGCVVSEF